MTAVTALTAARMIAIEAMSIISGAIVGNDLILTRFNGATINAGNVRGPSGLTPVMVASSTSSLAIGTGSKTFTLSPAMNVPFTVGAIVKATNSLSAYMVGTVTASTTTSVTINVSETAGSGTLASWTLTLGAFRGSDPIPATTSAAGISALATGAEVIAGTVADKQVTPATLGPAIDAKITADNDIPFVFVTRRAVQSLVTNTWVKILFDTEEEDFGNMWVSGSAGRLTCPVGKGGLYVVGGGGGIQATTTGRNGLMFYKNGVELPGGGGLTDADIETGMANTRPVRLAPGDYVEMAIYHEQGSSVNSAVANYSLPFMYMYRQRA